jgi:hypothetical protein
MPSNERFRRFGERDRFALEMRLLADPDGEPFAPLDSVGSWGEWRLWVNGLNLTEHDLTLPSGLVVRQDRATWYLAPLLRWLASSWTPLLHEERLPTRMPRHRDARSAYLSAMSRHADNPGQFAPWQDWAARHALRSAAEGGIVPDVFLRRIGDDIEFSWGDRWQPGAEDADYVIEPGVTHCDVAEVANALDRALTVVADAPAWRGHAWHRDLRERIEARPSVDALDEPLAWYFDGPTRPGAVTNIFRHTIDPHGDETDPPHGFVAHAITRLSPAAAMFGAVSPRISEQAAARLQAVITGCLGGNDSDELASHIRAVPAWRSAQPWEEGYSLALELLDDLDRAEVADPIDLDDLVGRWAIACREEALDGDGPLGVAVAGPDLTPTIVINQDHPTNRHEYGRRFTLAHELCHILHDRDRAGRVVHGSTRWAPLAIEQRANAFAAMLLMPPAAIRGTFRPRPGGATRADVIACARALHVGFRAAIQHLGNQGYISDDERDRLLDEAIDANLIHPPDDTP